MRDVSLNYEKLDIAKDACDVEEFVMGADIRIPPMHIVCLCWGPAAS